jgi:hypothetical protein
MYTNILVYLLITMWYITCLCKPCLELTKNFINFEKKIIFYFGPHLIKWKDYETKKIENSIYIM